MDDAELQSRLDNSSSLLDDIERAQHTQQAALDSARGRLDAVKQAYEQVRGSLSTFFWVLLWKCTVMCTDKILLVMNTLTPTYILQELQRHSRLVAARDAHNFNVQQRDDFVKQYAEDLGAPEGASGEQVAQRLQMAVADAQRAVDWLRAEHSAADDEATRRVDAAQGAVSSAREAARLARAQAMRNDAVIAQLQQEVRGRVCVWIHQ